MGPAGSRQHERLKHCFTQVGREQDIVPLAVAKLRDGLREFEGAEVLRVALSCTPWCRRILLVVERQATAAQF